MPKLVTVETCSLKRGKRLPNGLWPYRTKLRGHSYCVQGANVDQARAELRAKVAKHEAKQALANGDAKFDQIIADQRAKLAWFQLSGNREGRGACERILALAEQRDEIAEKLWQVDQENPEWASRLAVMSGPVGSSVGEVVESFIQWKQAAGVSVGRIKAYRTELADMQEIFGGANMPITGLNAALVTKLAQHYQTCPLAETTIAARWGSFKAFADYCEAHELIERVPKNINLYSFGVTTTNVESLTIAQIKSILGQVTDQERAWIVFMLNTAGTSVDVSSLQKSELRGDRIIRTRHKLACRRQTKKPKPLPLVNYPMWSETKRLLQKFPSTHPTLVFVRPSGEPIVTPKSDYLAKHFEKRQKHLTQAFTPKLFRASVATILAHSPYRQFAQQYLSHAPTSMLDRHYVTSGQADPQFDEAVIWLGRELGLHHQ